MNDIENYDNAHQVVYDVAAGQAGQRDPGPGDRHHTEPGAPEYEI